MRDGMSTPGVAGCQRGLFEASEQRKLFDVAETQKRPSSRRAQLPAPMSLLEQIAAELCAGRVESLKEQKRLF